MDVATFLRGLGLEQYEQAFRDNAIDGEVLPDLADADLVALGVLLGHRKKLLKAIAALQPAATDEAASPLGAAAPEPSPVTIPEAERRQLTVLFCDLVGSTELAAQLDPEDTRDVIRTYQNAVAGEIGRFEGHVAKFMGDGVLAYFGWPMAHEDEAERAVRAGLALAEAVGQLQTPAGDMLEARIGIATGLVVVGDIVGEGASEEQAVVGETPNLAARLQALAAPGQVVIAGATRRLLGAGFVLEHLGDRTLKGIGTPVETFAVTGERPLESRFEAMSGPALLPMVGRDQELALVLERWAQATAREGQGVLLVGEAGIGKSRLSRALLDAVATAPHVRIHYQCSPYHSDSALWPVIQQLNHVAGIDAEGTVEARLHKLETLLEQAGGRDAAPLIADLLGLDGTARYGKLGLTPQAQRARTLDALVEQLLGLAARQPVLVVLEDAHWIDPTTLELIEQWLDRIAAVRVLMLLTSRPDNQPSLAAHPHVTRLTLNRLSRAGVEAIVARLGGDQLPTATIAAIIARTDGVPLFVEELTKAVLETGETAIPASLHDSLMARLDRIPEVKEIAQTAACIGREFSHELLAAVADRSEADLGAALDQLVASGLMFRRGTPPAAIYTFKHSLVQDAAYQSLLKSKRQQLHARIALVLEDRFPETADTQPELLAHHCAEAGLIENAVSYWARAAGQSAERSAMAEAVVQSRNGLDLLARLPDNLGRSRKELELQSILAAALVATVGNAAEETGQAYARARQLCEQLGDTTTLVPVLSGLSTHHQTRSEFTAFRQTALELLRLGEERHDTASELVGNRSMALCLYHLGEFRPAREHFERVLSIYVPGTHHLLASIAAFDMRAVALSYLSLSLLILGYPEQARQWNEQSLIWSRSLPHPHTLAFSLNYAAFFHLLGRMRARADEVIDELRSLAIEQRFPIWLAGADIMRGYALTARGQAAEGLGLARKGLAVRKATGSNWHQTYFLGLLAGIAQEAGEPAEALSSLGTALSIADKTGERWFEAELHRLRGELLLALPGPDQAEAEDCLRQALAVAHEQQAKLWELRAATSLARLWRDQGKHAEARDLLSPVYGWFTEGFDTADLKDANELLEELR